MAAGVIVATSPIDFQFVYKIWGSIAHIISHGAEKGPFKFFLFFLTYVFAIGQFSTVAERDGVHKDAS